MGLTAIVTPGNVGIADALAADGAEELWANLSRRHSELGHSVSIDALIRAGDAAGMRFLIPGDPEWPTQLATLGEATPVNEIGGVPIGLWVVGGGNLAELTRDSVGITGSRASTAYGDVLAANLGNDLSDAGRSVVSGGAYGIDAAALRGALTGPTPTVAVLSGGLDNLYPAGHKDLFNRIAQRGVIVAEVAPGTQPTRIGFLARNRLTAALSDGTVLVEAAARSGAAGAVTWAIRLGRPAMAAPGPVTSANSVLPHRLIASGEATLITSAADVLRLTPRSTNQSPPTTSDGQSRSISPSWETVQPPLPRTHQEHLGSPPAAPAPAMSPAI
jgi:DNA processing protein